MAAQPRTSVQLGVGFWLLWTILGSLGFVVGGALGLLLMDYTYSLSVMLGAGAGLGLALGVTTHPCTRSAAGWTAATIIALGTVWLLFILPGFVGQGSTLPFLFSHLLESAIGRVIIGTVVGAALGAVQWLFMRRQWGQSPLWLVACSASATFSIGFAETVKVYEAGRELATPSGVILAFIPLLYQALTGVAFIWMMHTQPRVRSLPP